MNNEQLVGLEIEVRLYMVALGMVQLADLDNRASAVVLVAYSLALDRRLQRAAVPLDIVVPDMVDTVEQGNVKRVVMAQFHEYLHLPQ